MGASALHQRESLNQQQEEREEAVVTRTKMNEGLNQQQEETVITQTNLVSDGSVPAPVIDPNLINPWGVSSSATGPFWISDNGAGVVTIHNGAGTQIAVAGHNAIEVATPPGQTTPASPTGQVFNASGSGFDVSSGGVTAPSTFIFATEDGTISGWNPTVNSGSSILAVDNSMGGTGAVYKGLAIGQTDNGTFLFAANFRNGTVDVFDKDFKQVNSFTDPKVPAGFAPFNVQVLDNHLFVTFAKQDSAKHDDVAGPGNGFVDEFDLKGNLMQRVASGGPLDSPWGLAIAPSGFGEFANDLLVGNFGDGTINAFDPKNDHFLGKLLDANGSPITIQDLWALVPGNGTASDSQKIFFTAGLQNEAHGLFGSLARTPESAQSAKAMPGMQSSTTTNTAMPATATMTGTQPSGSSPMMGISTAMSSGASSMPAVMPTTPVARSNTTMSAMTGSQPSVLGSSNPLMEMTTAMSGALGSSSSSHPMLG